MPGEEREFSFKFTEKDFSLVLPDERRVMEAGKFEIMVGGSSDDAALTRIEFVQNKIVEIK